MGLEVGSRLGHYTVTAKLGEGGMGEVWEATDTKLNRRVALKILPEGFAADPDRMARFQREAQVLASLNHPNIAAIHGIEEQDDTRALVLELVEGPTLADRIAEGAIPVDEALPIAMQIAAALEAAHEAGVIHRDLKPANIKVREDGTVKVLDFGLAKALDTTPEGDPSQSPTLTAAATQMGVIMGTAAYMSPEQARGKFVDKRADIWSFGAVLFEMLTGQRAFQGEDVSLTLASVMKSDIDSSVLPADLPWPLCSLIHQCLQKDPWRRVRDIGDARLVMEGGFDPPTATAPSPAAIPRLRAWHRPVPAVMGVVAATMIASLVTWSVARPSPPQVTRFPLVLPAGTAFAATGRHVVALSPDGAHLVYAADNQLYLRAMDKLDATPIRGTEGARAPFFSFDGRWIGFTQEGQLKKISLNGDATVSLTDVGVPPVGASWGSDDLILFAEQDLGRIWRVAGAGGRAEVVIELEEGEQAHSPQMLPGGRWVLFTFRPNGLRWDSGQVVAQALDTGERRVLVNGGRDARYVQTGHLVYLVGETLFAMPFDVDTVTVTPGAVALVDGVDFASTRTGLAHFSLSEAGSLAYVAAGGVSDRTGVMGWVDREGRMTALTDGGGEYRNPRLSSDDGRVAFVSDGDIWVYDIGRGSTTRLTVEGLNLYPMWTRDDTRVTFASSRAGASFDLYWKPVDGTGEAEVLFADSTELIPGDWSRNGLLAFYEIGETERDLWVRGVDGEVSEFLETPFNERAPSVSPDGRWVAYVSDQSGDDRVYVQPFPDGGQVIPISTTRGVEPVWSRDGTELFFRDGDQMLVVEVTTSPTFSVGRPQMLFQGPYVADRNAQGIQNYDVASDGRFLMVRRPDTASVRFVVVQNWLEELKRLVSVD